MDSQSVDGLLMWEESLASRRRVPPLLGCELSLLKT